MKKLILSFIVAVSATGLVHAGMSEYRYLEIRKESLETCLNALSKFKSVADTALILSAGLAAGTLLHEPSCAIVPVAATCAQILASPMVGIYYSSILSAGSRITSAIWQRELVNMSAELKNTTHA